MRLDNYLDQFILEEISFADDNPFLTEEFVDDTGEKGKKFEKTMVNALKLAGLEMDVNTYAGSLWDIKPKGNHWSKDMLGQPVNIKQARTKWTWASSELYRMLPWDGFEGEFDTEKASKKVRRWLIKKGLHNVIYFKAKSSEIQDKINDLQRDVDMKNMDERSKKLKEIFSGKNFYAEKLQKGWNARVLTRDSRVSSIAIDSGGKVFMRSEKPRKLGGSIMVTFRLPTPIPGKGIERSVMS